MANNIMNAILILPTSPAKHFALPLGRKLNMQNTSTPRAATIKNEDIVSTDEFTINIPSGSEKCKVMLWTPSFELLCEADGCEIE